MHQGHATAKFSLHLMRLLQQWMDGCGDGEMCQSIYNETSGLKNFAGLWNNLLNCYCDGLPLCNQVLQSLFGFHVGGDVQERKEKTEAWEIVLEA